jgi:hypothetical protein
MMNSYFIISGSVQNFMTMCTGRVTIPSGVTNIGQYAFFATSITSVTIPATVTRIEQYAFVDTPNLSEVIFEGQSQLNYIGMYAFHDSRFPSGISSLTSITIPASVETIDSYAFSGLELETLIFEAGSNLRTIQSFAFAGSRLNSLTIPSSVQTINFNAFQGSHTFTTYSYCGEAVSQIQLDNAGLTGKTKNCAPVYVPPMLPSVAPSIAVNNGVITCTAGEYSMAATSVVFSLFVDGNHVATNFSSTGDYLPSWLALWADPSTIQRTASLTSASWTTGLVGTGKKVSCWTLAYSQHATGLISSDQISLP